MLYLFLPIPRKAIILKNIISQTKHKLEMTRQECQILSQKTLRELMKKLHLWNKNFKNLPKNSQINTTEIIPNTYEKFSQQAISNQSVKKKRTDYLRSSTGTNDSHVGGWELSSYLNYIWIKVLKDKKLNHERTTGHKCISLHFKIILPYKRLFYVSCKTQSHIGKDWELWLGNILWQTINDFKKWKRWLP